MMKLLALVLAVVSLPVLAGDLEFNTLSAKEGGDSFTLEVNVFSPADGGDDDYYGYHKRASTFDSVDLYNYVRVSPATKFSISAKRNGFILVGDFKPETNYKVSLNAGLSSREGSKLKAAGEKEVRTGSFSPRLTFKSKSRYMPGALQGSLAWEAMNVRDAEFEVRQVYAQNLHQFLSYNEYANERNSDVIKTIKVPVKGRKNKKQTGVFSLSDLNTLGQGVFVVTAKPPSQKGDEPQSTGGGGGEGDEDFVVERPYYESSRYDQATLIVTNLTVIVKRGPTQAKVWVMNTKDLTPVKDAQVDLIAPSNRKMDGCRTSGSTAECTLNWKKMENGQPFALTVHAGKDMTYVRFEDVTLPNDAFQAGKRDFSASNGGLDGYIYPERDLYRPGETVRVSAMVRNQKFDAVGKMPVRWTITNPRGKVVRESVSDTTEFGMAQMEYASTPAADTGKYTIAATAGKTVLHETSVMIEEFVPERIGLKVQPQQEVMVNKTSVPFNVTALYLFGPPVAGGTYKLACSMKPAFSEIPNRPGYKTGLYSAEPKQAVTLQAKEGTLNEKGVVQEACALEGDNAKLSEAFELRAKVDVNEAGSGRATSKSGTGYVASTDTLIGLKLDGNSNRTIKVRGGLFDFKGMTKNAKATVRVKLFNVREHWFYSYNSYDSWKSEEIVTPTSVEKTIEVTNGTFDFTVDAPEGWGRWVVRAVDAKTGYTADLDAGYIGWYYSDRAKPGMKSPEPNALKVEVSKSEVAPGEKIQAMVNAPFAGRVLFAFETDRVLETQWVKVDKPGMVKVDLKVPEALPNVYLTALLMKDPTEAGGKRFLPARAWGATSLRVIPSEHQLDVKVEHAALSESRKPVTFTLTNTQKGAAEYSLAIVDEGILQITDFKSPDPLKRFFEARSMGVLSAETLGWTVAMDGASGKNPGGDKADGAAGKTMPVKLVSYWYPNLKSDSSGKAQVSLTLPPFQGKVRVMAVASAKGRMGSSSTEMTVRDPLVLQPTLPRFLTQGDKFQFPVSVMNLSGKDQTVTVDVNAGALVSLAAAKQTAAIPNGQTRVLRFDADVKGINGTAAIKISATSADGKLNSVDSFNLPVKPSGVEQTIRLSLDPKAEINLSQHIPPTWRTDYAKIDAAVSPMPYLNQISHLDTLIHYPYGCIEQTTSGTLPLLTMTDLMQWVDSKPKGDIKDMVNKGIARVFSMQTASGGFGYWPGDGEPNPWGTAYATFMLLEAKKLGYEVSASNLKLALDYLENYTRQNSYKLASTKYNDGAESLAIYVLAKGGRQVTQQLRDTIRSGVALTNGASYSRGLYTENYFLLAASAKLLGDKDSAKKLNDDAINVAQVNGTRDGEYTYWSPMRTDGLRLAVLQDVMPDAAGTETLAQRVAANLAKKDGFYYSTQDIAWSVLGLGKRVAGIKKIDTKELAKANVTVNGKALTKAYEVAGAPGFVYEGAGLNAAKMAVASIPQDKGVFLYVKATGYTKAPPVGQSSVRVQRVFHRRDGTGLDPSSIKVGDTVFVELMIQNTGKDLIRNLAIVDRLPAGFEIENPRLGKSEETDWMKEAFKADYQDMRDDRVQVFGDLTGGQTASIYYSARAVTKGRFTAPAAMIEAMYEPTNFNYDKDTAIQILDAAAKK